MRPVFKQGGRFARTGHPLNAFTLIELLVVVSIVALLISLLVPALSRAREQAKIAMCTANLRAIAMASVTYAASDKHEHAVPIHPLIGQGAGDFGAYDWGGKSGQGETEVAGSPELSIWGTAAGYGPATRPLNAVLFKGGFADYKNNPGPNQINWINDTKLDLRVLRCPSDRGYTGHHYVGWKNSPLSSYDHYGNSYVANTFAGGLQVFQESRVISASPYYRGMARIANPANTVYYLENCGRFAWHLNRGSSEDPGVCAPSTTGYFAAAEGDLIVEGWHRRRYHFATAFADGHARMVKMRGMQIPPPALSHYGGVDGAAYAGSGFLWPCLIIRGAGWKLDTLPSPVIVTPILSDLYTPFQEDIQ